MAVALGKAFCRNLNVPLVVWRHRMSLSAAGAVELRVCCFACHPVGCEGEGICRLVGVLNAQTRQNEHVPADSNCPPAAARTWRLLASSDCPNTPVSSSGWRALAGHHGRA